MELKKNLPIRPSEMGVLNIITETPGPHTSVLLTELLGVSKPMIATHISVLEKKGYITKQQSEDDKRVFYILPTEKAKELVASEKEKMDIQLGELAKKIGKNEFDNLIKSLSEVNKILEADREE